MLKVKENLRASLIENPLLCSKFYIYILNWVVFSRRHWSYYHIILVCILHQHLLDFNFVENEANLKVLLPSATILYFSWSAENFLFAGGLCWSCQESQQLEGKIYINHRYSKTFLSSGCNIVTKNGLRQCVCGMGCEREFEFQYRNECIIKLMGQVFSIVKATKKSQIIHIRQILNLKIRLTFIILH